MLTDARERLREIREAFTDPREIQALDEVLSSNTLQASLGVVEGKVVWLFTGEIYQVAVPFEKAPVLTSFARENGLFETFYTELAEEAVKVLYGARLALFPGEAK